MSCLLHRARKDLLLTDVADERSPASSGSGTGGKLVFLHGAPASGKLTVARALLRQLPGRLFDNHAAIDFALSLFAFGSSGFWELVQSVRLSALEAAAQHRIPLVVMTFCYSEPEDLQLFEQFEAVFGRQGGNILPVYLHCSIAEAERRVANADRIERGKTSSVAALTDFHARWTMAPVPRPGCLHLDTEHEHPDALAGRIIRHFHLA